MGNLVGMPVMIVPVGFAPLENPPSSDSQRRRTITTGIYAPPQHDHIVSFMSARVDVCVCGQNLSVRGL